MATFISVDGSEREVQPKNGKHFTLEELQEYAGGYIEMVRLPSGGWLVFDEDGKMKDLPRNDRATPMGHACGIADNDYIVGNVLVAKSTEID